MGLRKTASMWAAPTLIVMLMTACGGGGGGDSPPPPTPPAVPAPVIATAPQTQSALTGASVTFNVAATGSALSYQWRRNGVPIVGATAASYTTPPVSYLDHQAQYTVVVSNTGGSVTGGPVQVTLTLSPDQQVYEEGSLSPSGSHRLRWNLNYSGPQTSGVNYAYSEQTALAASPLTAGPQVITASTPHNLSSTLALVNLSPTRVLKNGAILLVPGTTDSRRISYVGSSIRSENLAADNSTVAYSTILSGLSRVSLSGTLANTPAEMAQWFNSFWSNPAVLNTATNYGAGSSYLKFTATNEGDRYDVFDCTTATLTVNVTPCRTGVTLQAALTTGIQSNSDGRTYVLADGTVSTVGGVTVWVATAPRPISATLTTTVQHRIYFALNGNVYTGSLVRDGVVIGGSYFVSTPGAPAVEDRLTFFQYQIRLNQAARDSIAGAMAL